MRVGDSVQAVRDIETVSGGKMIRAGCRGAIVDESTSHALTVSFKDRAWGSRKVTISGLRTSDLRVSTR